MLEQGPHLERTGGGIDAVHQEQGDPRLGTRTVVGDQAHPRKPDLPAGCVQRLGKRHPMGQGRLRAGPGAGHLTGLPQGCGARPGECHGQRGEREAGILQGNANGR